MDDRGQPPKLKGPISGIIGKNARLRLCLMALLVILDSMVMRVVTTEMACVDNKPKLTLE